MKTLEENGGFLMAPIEESTSRETAASQANTTAKYLSLSALLLAAWWIVYRNLPAFADQATQVMSKLMGFQVTGRLGSAVSFFIFEAPKVLLLLVLVVYGVGVVRSFFTPERTRNLLAGRRESVGNVLASMLGIVTPFCSCSAVPLFLGFVTTGVPLGVTFSFLIAAPMVNEVALVLLYGLFGWKVALSISAQEC